MTPASTIGQQTKKQLKEAILAHRPRIEEWFAEQARLAPPPFYCSIDLRDSGYKIAPVDSNLYPAGFNNICPEDMRTAPPLVRKQIEAGIARAGLTCPNGQTCPKRILILPEAHTSNQYYAENLYYLNQLVSEAGFETRIGWYPEAEGPVHLTSATGKEFDAYPIRITEGVLSADGFVPDLILLNNDFSGGYPERLDSVKQPILPSHRLGWHSRKKSEHFRHYNALAGEFATIIGVDPWLLQVDTEEVTPVNFNEDVGIRETESVVGRMLERIRAAYERHKVNRKPFVFVKNNAGTYGMGIMTVHDANELEHLNRRAKNKMSVGKGKMAIESVVVQEGIPTATIVDRLAAEPVIYLFGSELIGGFLRTNTERGDEDNLNSQGMAFRKLCMSDLRSEDDEPHEIPTMELVYGSIARISALAAGRELAERQQNAGR